MDNNVNIVSTTDSEDAVNAALGNLAKEQDLETKKSVSNQGTDLDETKENSDNSEDLEETSDEDESEEIEKDDEVKDDKPKKKGGFKKRIERFQRQLSEKDQEIASLRQQVSKTNQPQNVDEQKNESINKDTSGKPKASDFETHEDYVEALTDWKLEQREKINNEKKQKETVLNQVDQARRDFSQKISEFSKTASDFQELIEDLGNVVVSPALEETLHTSDVGVQVLYELAKNPQEFSRVNGLSPLALAREIGRLESKILSQQSSSKEVKTTKAPPPLKTVSSNTKAAKSPDDMDFQEYKKWRASNKK